MPRWCRNVLPKRLIHAVGEYALTISNDVEEDVPFFQSYPWTGTVVYRKTTPQQMPHPFLPYLLPQNDPQSFASAWALDDPRPLTTTIADPDEVEDYPDYSSEGRDGGDGGERRGKNEIEGGPA